MDWNYSFRAFRLFGTEVRVHWSLPAFCVFYLLRAAQHGYSLSFLLLFVALPMLLLFASVVAHEFGHVFAARHYRLETDFMVLTPIGGVVMVVQPVTPSSEFVVASAGPLVNLLLGAIAWILHLLLGGPFDLGILLPFGGDDAFGTLWRERHLITLVLRDFAQTNLMLFWFNVLLVAYPMDGGRMLMAALWSRRGYHRALALACNVARVLAGGMLVAAVVLLRPMLGVIAFFVFVQATTTLRRVPMLPDPSSSSAFARFPSELHRPHRPLGRPSRPSWWRRFRDRARERRVRALLARAELEGLAALTEAERRFLKKMRESRDSPS